MKGREPSLRRGGAKRDGFATKEQEATECHEGGRFIMVRGHHESTYLFVYPQAPAPHGKVGTVISVLQVGGEGGSRADCRCTCPSSAQDQDQRDALYVPPGVAHAAGHMTMHCNVAAELHHKFSPHTHHS
jgi:hypothetical protein